MVSPEDAVARRFRRYGGQRCRQSVTDNQQFAVHVDGEDRPATTRDVVNGLLLGLSIGALIAVGLYAL